MVRRQTIIIDNIDQEPKRVTLFRLIKSNFHWKCLLSTLLVHVCILYGIWCHIKDAYKATVILTYTHGPCSQGYNFIPIGFGVLLYLIYLTECWNYKVKNSKILIVNINELEEYIEKLKESTPIVWWKSICYHYLRRSRQVTRYRNGDTVTSTQIYYERVNSHTAGNIFLYDTCGYRDISKKLKNLDKYSILKIKFSKGFVFANIQAANEFEEQRTRFFNENELKDDYMEVKEGLDLIDIKFIDEMLIYKKNTIPWYLNKYIYWILSILLLSWPLRIFNELMIGNIYYQITKLFGTNYLSPSSINYTGPLTRTSTIESIELERALRDNYLIVPSYSEAVLLDPINPNNFIFSQIRNHIITENNNNNNLINNENVYTNYGAIRNYQQSTQRQQQQPPPPPFESRPTINLSNIKIPSRSKSMNFTRNNNSTTAQDIQNSSTANNPIPRPSQLNLKKQPLRSISISGISGTARSSGYQTQINSPIIENNERRPLIPYHNTVTNEPPPSYEVALRMCAPIYNRIRQSANSISSLLNSLSRSNSKDFRQYSMDGPSNS